MLFFRVPQFRITPLPRPELRKDPIIDRWTVISTDRLGRPQEYEEEPPSQPLALCPFCAGHEHLTPPPTFVAPPSGPWQVRAVPNTFPAVRGHEPFRVRSDGLLHAGPAPGIHEVIIACPQHETALARLPAAHLATMFLAFRERLRAIARFGDPCFPFIFHNHRAAAGASMEHAHVQLLTLPVPPELVAREQEGCRRAGRCLFCDLIAQELADGSRVIFETPKFVALTAYAGRFPCEAWLLPRQHTATFERISEEDLSELGDAFRMLLKKLDRGLSDPPFNFYLHSAGPEYHWHIEVLPRLTGTAGFEWGTNMNINPIPPEQAAAYLRGIEEE
jgi:UDPglucose--hexose-1-phosphate uridylyltransferase